MTTSSELQDRWTVLSAKYLPVQPENSIWRYSRKQFPHDPPQGWKIHLSSTVLTAGDILSTIGPLLKASKAFFKAPISLDILMLINSGIVYGYSQVGKFITIYPRDESEFVSFVEMLEPLLAAWSSNPNVPFDFRFKSTCIYYRYGAFGSKLDSSSNGSISSIVSPRGIEIEDPRKAVSTQFDWLKDPFGKRSSVSIKPKTNKLNSRYIVYEALSQRGKGGVYECLDVLDDPPRKCIMKEGRKNGETTWDGRDGKSRIRNEAKVLASLATTRAKVPRIYDRFTLDHNEYLVIERIEGTSLNVLMERGRRRLSLGTLLKICLQLCEIVASIHQMGWVWRDCKPRNFIVDMHGTVRAIDFEGACRSDKPDALPWSTKFYTPPEMVKANSVYSEPPNFKHDLFALGVCIFQILEGKLPVSNPNESWRKITRRGVSPEIKEQISRLLSHSPQERPEASKVAGFLQQFLTASPDDRVEFAISTPSRAISR